MIRSTMSRAGLAVLFAGASLATVPAFAQTNAAPQPMQQQMSPAGSGAAMDTTSTKMPGTVSTQDFVQKLPMGNQFEIETSEIGVQKAKSPELKKFAQQMIADHKKAGDQFKAALKKSNAVNDMSTATVYDEKHRQAMEKLRAASAADFDETYTDIQLDAHRETVALVKSYAQTGADPQLKSFAQEVLPTLEMHLSHIEKIKAGA